MSFEAAATAAELAPCPGKQALENKYRASVEVGGGIQFSHSVDVDAHFQPAEPNSNRWDYGLGLVKGNTHFAIWIESHGATSSREVDKVLAKLAWLKGKLRSQKWSQLNSLTSLTAHQGVQQFWWLVPGTVSFRPGSKEAQKLAQCGMKMPVKKVVIR
jgi:hypothetical protein